MNNSMEEVNSVLKKVIGNTPLLFKKETQVTGVKSYITIDTPKFGCT